jgi:hypothetical protein
MIGTGAKIKLGAITMNLKKLFPVAYKQSLLVSIIVYLIIGIIASLAIGFAGLITGWIPLVGAIVGWVLRIVGAIVDLYVVCGIIVAILLALKVIK